jgi:hypothetical protein
LRITGEGVLGLCSEPLIQIIPEELSLSMAKFSSRTLPFTIFLISKAKSRSNTLSRQGHRWIGKFERGRLRMLAELKKRLEGETNG